MKILSEKNLPNHLIELEIELTNEEQTILINYAINNILEKMVKTEMKKVTRRKKKNE
jgi:hypothetical protein